MLASFWEPTFAQISPSVDQNYILSRSITYPISDETQIATLSDNRKSEVVEYSNGLGKPSQIVKYRNFKLNGTIYKDLVTPIEYDVMGLNSKIRLPYSVDASGSFKSLYGPFPNPFGGDPRTAQEDFYFAPPTGIEPSSFPFSLSIIEKSPLLRITQQGFPGVSWQPNETNPLSDHSIKTYLETNTHYEVIVWELVVETSGGITIQGNSYYNPAVLYKTKTIDENGVISCVYKDKNEKEILKTTIDGVQTVKTYYVYDKLNRLRFVVPPKACDDNILKNPSFPISLDVDHPLRKSLITEYKYDTYNREVEKIMPEEQPVWTVYDQAGRVVLRQDGILRDNFDWLFTKYDRKGRVIMTGIYHRGAAWSRTEAQDFVNANIGAGKTYKFYDEHTASVNHGYTDLAFPSTSNCQIYTVNYYDDYNFDNNGTDDVTFQDAGFSDVDYDDTQYPTDYGDYKISGHTPFDRTSDKVTMKKVLLFGSKGNALEFDGNKTYNYNPPSPENIYYHGSVVLSPGFRTYSDQKVSIGPNIVVPPGTSLGNEDYLTTVYFYDKYGRVIQTQAQNHLGGSDISSTQYEFSGKVIRTKLTHTTDYSTVTVYDRFTYDQAGRLVNSYKNFTSNPALEKLISRNEYNELGQLITKKLDAFPGNNDFLQTVDYRYNIRGWLKSVNNLSDPANPEDDLFAFNLYYDNIVGNELNNTPKYNGNISAMAWGNTMTSKYAYKYEYDNLNRLTEAQTFTNGNPTWQPTNELRETGITYDLNGNIQSIKRFKLGTQELIDDLTYSYDAAKGNMLYRVEDAVPNTTATSYDFEETEGIHGQEYFYDHNGNLWMDMNKGIVITYNYLNLPVEVKWNASPSKRIEWMYDATGNKLRKTVYSATGEATNIINYANGFVYTGNFDNPMPQLSFFPMSEGRVVSLGNNNYNLQYMLKDHLGNTRVMFDNNNGTAYITQTEMYYPFGLTVTTSVSGDENKFKYNGKELEDEHGLNWYHYGVRYYDPQLGRWHTMDPADEFHSPYLYVGNNPVKYIDPDGAQVATPEFSFSNFLRDLFGMNDLKDYDGNKMKEQSEVITNRGLTNHQHAEIKQKVFETYITMTAKTQLTALSVTTNLVGLPLKGALNVAFIGLAGGVISYVSDSWESKLTSGISDYSSTKWGGAFTFLGVTGALAKFEPLVNLASMISMGFSATNTSFQSENDTWKAIRQIKTPGGF